METSTQSCFLGVRVDPLLAAHATAAARRLGISLSELTRQALARELEEARR